MIMKKEFDKAMDPKKRRDKASKSKWEDSFLSLNIYVMFFFFFLGILMVETHKINYQNLMH